MSAQPIGRKAEIPLSAGALDPSMEEKILTLHPQGKKGVNISKAKYDVMKGTILDVLRDSPGLTHPELTAAVEKRLEGRFEGSIPWYMESTKLDLEARRVIERTDSSPAMYRIRDR